MFKIKISLVLAVAACTFSAIATPALAFKEFQAKNPGTQLKDTNTNVHVFETGGAGSVECSRAVSKGVATQMKASTIKIDVKYEGCEVKFLGSHPATVTQAKYLFQAKGKTSVENTIKIEVPEVGCKITVEPESAGGKNKELGTVTYTNLIGDVEVKAAVEGITQKTEGSESLCGKSASNGKYKGTSIEAADEGNIRVA
jgi:hypothetical protein